MKDEALKLALEALEGSTNKTLSILAIKALREALAEQPITEESSAVQPAPAQQNERNIRNATLDEIASKIALMPFGDTAASFAVWIREQKQ
tara:strand:+ start:6708 stop:6980 length:273 start_codon:yes stop_codon:yes gene_type:complete